MSGEAQGDLRTLANGLFPSGLDPVALTPEGRDEVRAAVDVILKLWDHQSAHLQLALKELDRAAGHIEQTKAETPPHPAQSSDGAKDEIEEINFESIAQRCARAVRGCATDEQYNQVIDSIVEALRFSVRPSPPEPSDAAVGDKS